MSKPITIPNVFQTLPGPLPLANLDQDFTTLANAINDVATYSNYFVDSSGAANVITVTTPTALAFSLTAGVQLQIKLANTNTATGVTVNVNGGGVQTLLNADGTAPAVGQLVAAQILPMIYDGTAWRLSGPQSKSYATGSIAPFVATGAGNVSLAAASSGITLSVAGDMTLGQRLQVTGAGITGFSGQGIELFATGGTGSVQAVDRTNSVFLPVSVGGLSLTLNYGVSQAAGITITSAGNVQVSSPTSGTALLVTNTGSADALDLSSGSGNQCVLGFLVGGSTKGFCGAAGTAGQLATNSAANDLVIGTFGGKLLFGTNTGGYAYAFIDSSGNLNANNGNGAASGPVYSGIPQTAPGGGYTLVLTDANRHILLTGGALTIPANSSVPFPIGTAITVVNSTGASQTISITTDSLRWAANAGSGTRTLGNLGMASMLKITSTTWLISGSQLT